MLKKSTEGYGIGVNLQLMLAQKLSLLVEYSYERPFKAGTGQQVCNPIGTTTSTSCTSANVGAPVRTIDHIASFETRVLLTNSLAIAPQIQYDTTHPNLGLALPLYFVAKPKSTLNGGIEAGWTRSSGYQGAVLIQKAFSFLDF